MHPTKTYGIKRKSSCSFLRTPSSRPSSFSLSRPFLRGNDTALRHNFIKFHYRPLWHLARHLRRFMVFFVTSFINNSNDLGCYLSMFPSCRVTNGLTYAFFLAPHFILHICPRSSAVIIFSQEGSEEGSERKRWKTRQENWEQGGKNGRQRRMPYTIRIYKPCETFRMHIRLERWPTVDFRRGRELTFALPLCANSHKDPLSLFQPPCLSSASPLSFVLSKLSRFLPDFQSADRFHVRV